MSFDTRIDTHIPPCFGCHSDFDKIRKTPAPECNVTASAEEKACNGCVRRRTEAQQTASAEGGQKC